MKGKSSMLIVGVGVVAIALAIFALFKSHASKRAQFAVSGAYPLPKSFSTFYDTGITRAVPSSFVDYTLRNHRPLDNSQNTAPSGGTLKSEGHSFAVHGSAGEKNQDILRNSLYNINISTPHPILFDRGRKPLIIAGAPAAGHDFMNGMRGAGRGAG
jgi:hypothetical protein